MSTYPDEYLHYWSDVFMEVGIAEYTTLEAFLSAPQEWIRYIEGGEFRPLLPAQRRARDGIASQEGLLHRVMTGAQSISDEMDLERSIAAARGIQHCPRRNGRAIEPLHHHRHPDKRLRRGWFRPRNA